MATVLFPLIHLMKSQRSVKSIIGPAPRADCAVGVPGCPENISARVR
jgi:hypothetical protein